ncbi:hypothetical protein SpCBS45565_g05680 [Spizellomyces sp. 'palustris']|nr:hypothetical protein SpCBS45565_g05680 [Spizellomyces sp. 'palustris']
MAADLDEFLETHQLDNVNLIGHSMGGKAAAMHYALSHPERLNHLIVVDMSPTNRNLTSEFGSYIEAMHKVEKAKVKNQSEADKILAESINSLPIRQFILTNLKKAPGETSMKFRINLPALEQSLEKLWEFPFEGSGKTYDGPALFIAGARAGYITQSTHPVIKTFFPNAEITALDTGHW